MATQTQDVLTIAKKAKNASSVLAHSPSAQRNKALELLAHYLEEQATELLQANDSDLSSAQDLVSQGKLSEALYSRLKLDHAKIADLASGIRYLSTADDPLGQLTLARELDQDLKLFRVTAPIGVIGVIFESRPDAFPQIASLCIKSGNAVILKGGSEAHNSNLKLFELAKMAISEAGLPHDCIALLESRKDIADLLQADDLVDLIIPRGSNELVRHIQKNTRIPVLGHAEGVCHLYVDKAADLQKAINLTVDSKVQYPAACNAIETLLVHKDVADTFLPPIVDELIKHKVTIRADDASKKIVNRPDVKSASEDDWSTEYSDLILSVKIVDSLDEAISHINAYGSGHTDTIVSEDSKAYEQFCAAVNSAGVFVNASTRFADGYRYGFGAEVGISTGKLHPRGPVGMEGLVTYKYKLIGKGHVVSDYVGKGAKKFTHREL